MAESGDVNGTQPMEINHMQHEPDIDNLIANHTIQQVRVQSGLVAQQAVNNVPVIQRLIPDERYVPGKRISLSQVLFSLSNVPIIVLISSILLAKTVSFISQSKI
jgi:hypothetical protein